MSVPAFVQKNQTWPSTSAASTALAFLSNVAAGSRLAAVVAWNSITETASVSDSLNGAWAAVGSPQPGAGSLSAFSIQVFVSPPTLPGACTVTATFTAALTRRGLAICEYSGIRTTADVVDDFDYVAVNSSGLILPSIDTTYGTDVLFAACVAAGSITGVGGGYTARADAATWGGNGTEDQIVFAAGTYTPNFIESAAQDNLGAIIALKGAADPNDAGTTLIAGRLPPTAFRRPRFALGAPHAVDQSAPVLNPIRVQRLNALIRAVQVRTRRRPRFRLAPPKVIDAPAGPFVPVLLKQLAAIGRRRIQPATRSGLGAPRVVSQPTPVLNPITRMVQAAGNRVGRVARPASSVLGFPGAVVGPQTFAARTYVVLQAGWPDRWHRRTKASLGPPRVVNPFVPPSPPVDATVDVRLAGRTRANLARRRTRPLLRPPSVVAARPAVLVPIQTVLTAVPGIRRLSEPRRKPHTRLRPPTVAAAVEACSAPVGPVTALPQATAPNVLGCAEYQVAVLTRGGGELVALLPWTRLSWGRVLDDTSTAAVSGAADESCCGVLAEVKQWRHEIAIYRSGELVWVGPIIQKRLPPGEFEIQARDLSAWLDHRKIHQNHVYSETDLSVIFEDLFNDALEPDPSPNIALSISFSGVKASKRFLKRQNLIAAAQLRDITTTGIDWTAIGREIVAGGLAVPTSPVGTFIDEHFIVPPTPLFSGEQQGNAVTVRGAGGGSAGDVIASTATDFDAVQLDGLLETVESVSTIKDIRSAIQAADTRLALRKESVQIESCVLAPNAPFPISSLVPGALAPVNLQGTCAPVVGTYRLKSIAVTASAGEDDSVTLTFQPEGTTDESEAA